VGWDGPSAEAACVGEAIERCLSRPLPQDRIVRSAFAAWTLDEPAVEPGRWALFHAEQHAQPGFPFAPFTQGSECRWVCCRVAGEGGPCWAPEWLVYLQPADHPFGPSLSTGLSCGRVDDPVLLRGLQEVIERDALVGAWWERYRLEEHDPERVFALLPPDAPHRLRRPNLVYRCYRVASPYSDQVTIVTLEGEDCEGYCFSAGSACRETRAASWAKALLEAVQGRYYVRYLKTSAEVVRGGPVDFAGHALHYSLHPEELRQTIFRRAVAGADSDGTREDWPVLAERLRRPVLFRLLTPPALSAERLGWVVLRVLVPGLQPLHGHHGYPFLGGPLWAPRRADEWRTMRPHPFP
jgi:ribosomal protein S12 methylthiotransferase accessory factor